MLVSKQLDLCFGGVGNTGWKTEEEEEQVSLHLDEERMPTGSQVLAGVCVYVHVCECVRAWWSECRQTFRNGWEKRAGEGTLNQGFRIVSRNLGWRPNVEHGRRS